MFGNKSGKGKLSRAGRECKEQWEAYTTRLKVSHVRLRNTKDELVWLKNPTLGFYTHRIGLKAMFVND